MSSGRSIFDLPGHIITDILSRLPIKTIIHCRCVCRTWRSLVLDPHFANLHLSRTPTILIIHQESHRSPDWDSDILKLIEFDRDEHDQHGNGLLHYDPLMNFDLKRFPNTEILLVGSVNGLLCFCDYENEAIFICNPIMRECVTLPKPIYTERYPTRIVYGFGYSSLSGQYKVVQISQTPLLDPEGLPFWDDSQGAVYVLGTANWRSIGTVPYLDSRRSYNLSLNGNIHWLNWGGETSELICSFDVENESFQVFPSPNNLIKQTWYASLGLFRDCLCLCVPDGSEDYDIDIDIWVMKEYGVKESWTKEIVIRQNSSELSCLLCDEVSLLHVWENGDILILWRDDRLYLYSPERKTLEEVEDPRDSSHIVSPFIIYKMMLHVPSFLSLKDFERERVDMF